MRRREFLGGALLLAALAGCSRAVPGLAAATGARPSDGTPAVAAELRGTGSRMTAAAPRSVSGEFSGFSAGLLKAAAMDGNYLVSPYSVLSALGMTALGAAGVTASRLSTLLGSDAKTVASRLTAVDAALADAIKQSDQSTEDSGETVIDAANSLFSQAGLEVHRAFLDALTTGYGAALRTLDFSGHPEDSRAEINKWVSAKTAALIPALLPPGSVTTDTRLALVNAIHLKAPWSGGFVKGAPVTPFTTAAGKRVDVSLMTAQNDIPYVAGDLWRAVSLPYAGEGLAMTVILPDEGQIR